MFGLKKRKKKSNNNVYDDYNDYDYDDYTDDGDEYDDGDDYDYDDNPDSYYQGQSDSQYDQSNRPYSQPQPQPQQQYQSNPQPQPQQVQPQQPQTPPQQSQQATSTPKNEKRYVNVNHAQSQQPQDNQDYQDDYDDGYSGDNDQRDENKVYGDNYKSIGNIYHNGAESFKQKDVDAYNEQHNTPSTVLGQPSLIQVIAPAYWSTDDLMQEQFVMRESMAHRTYGMAGYVPPTGYPTNLQTQVFQKLLNEKNVDVTLDIVPRSRRESIKSLSNMLTTIRSNALFQEQQGQANQLRDTVIKYNDIRNLLDQIQVDEDREYDLSISFIVYGKSQKDLEKNWENVEDILGNAQMSVVPYTKRVKSGYLQTLPMGIRMRNLDDTYRNVNRRALSIIDIARNAEGRFNGGIPFGNNLDTPSANTEFLNIFGTKYHRPANYNCGIIGEAGSGKSTANKVKIAREVSLMGWEHRSIDPDGEYVPLAQKLGGLNINLVPDSHFVINPCAITTTETPIEEEQSNYSNGKQLTTDELEEKLLLSDPNIKIVTHDDGSKYVKKANVNAMINNVADFVDVIISSSGSETEGSLRISERQRIIKAMQTIVKDDLGITTNPDSLFQDRSGYVGRKFYSRIPKREPTLSDLYAKLKTYGEQDPNVSRVLDALQPFLKTGTEPLFDGQTNFGENMSTTLNDYKYVNFNLKSLDGSLKEVAYFVVMTYLWEQWMNNPDKALVHKVLDADEILQFIDSPKMFAFFERIVRRDRKRNGSLTWLTQDIARFNGNEQAQSLVTNSEFMFLLMIKPQHAKLMQETMDLNEGALEFLTSHPDRGEGILREEGENIKIRTNIDEGDWDFAESNPLVGKEHKNGDFIDELEQAMQ